MEKYVLNGVSVLAFRWTGDKDQIAEPDWIVSAIRNKSVIVSHGHQLVLHITDAIALGGTHIVVERGDYVIRHVDGKLWSMGKDVFEALSSQSVPNRILIEDVWCKIYSIQLMADGKVLSVKYKLEGVFCTAEAEDDKPFRFSSW